MNCPVCQHANPKRSSFCQHCGNRLKIRCPQCDRLVRVDFRFCNHCGYEIGAAASAPTRASERPRGSPTAPHAERPHPAPAQSISPAPQTAAPERAAPDTNLQRLIPKELLSKLDAARASGEMVGERRVVSMLFCDVKGSTAAAEQLDPEDWAEIMNGAFECMIEPIYAYEGTVARLMGDAVLAFFGAPIAHEDDPQRAVLAGLDIVSGITPYRAQIKQRWGIDLNVRIGINTGLVVVGAVGSDLRVEYSALGDAINLAARMEQTASPGSVQIAYDTYKLVRFQFEVEELGGIEVKGKSEPVRAYRVLGRKATAARARGIEGLRAEMVGRADEMQVLQNVVNDLKQGVGRIVCVIGEAGLGKSRLIAEAHAAWKTLLGPNGNWFESGSLSYESGHAYGLFQRLIRNVSGIAYDDPPALVREKLAPVVEGFPEAERAHHWQVLEALFGLAGEPGAAPLDGDAFKRELYELMHDWWRGRFAAQPTVLVFDDMHWSDAASVDLLRQLLPLSDEIPLVLLCAMRAERQSPAWQIKLSADEEYPHRYSEILLRPLSDAESTELVNRLLSNPTLPERLLTNILEKSSGNPFFIEEVVRTLIDSGAVVSETQVNGGEARRTWRAVKSSDDFAIPDTLQSLLAARMDRLEESTRGTLQIASVIGRSFYQRVLQAVDQSGAELDKRLSTLLRLEMIREAARVPELEYTFRNPLTQEAVYHTILLKRRREFHRRVGEAMESIYPDRLERLYGLLAHHFALAGLRDKAIHYYRQAAHQAITLYAYDDAVLNLRASLALIAGDEASVAHVLLLEELGDVYRLLRDGAGAMAQYQAALERCHPEKGGDPLLAVRLHRKTLQVVSDLKWSVGVESLQQANECRLTSRASLVDALQRLQSAPEHSETVRVLVALSTDAWRIQEPPDWPSAQRFAQQAVDMARQLNDAMELSQALGALANVLDGRSLLRDHLQVVEQRLALCGEREFSDMRESIEAHRAVGAALMYVGEYEKALSFLREAEEQSEHGHVVEQQVNAIGLQAQCFFRLDRWDDVLAAEERWRTLERQFPRERVGET